MRWENIYLAGLGSWLPAAVPAREAVDAGLLDSERFKTLGYVSICVGEDVAPPDMAVHAVRSALERSGVDGRDVGLLLHGSLWFQGLDIYPVASYVAGHAAHRGTVAFDLQQRCNVGLGGLELAAGFLTGSDAGSAVLSTADRFAAPAVNRWTMHDFNIYGDGGTAMVLSRRRGFARLLATATAADNTLEAQARGGEGFHLASPAVVEPIDLLARSAAHAESVDPVQVSTRIGKVMVLARNRALKAAGVPLSDIARVVTPASGRVPGDYQLHDLIGVPEERTTWEYGRTVGHVGGGDWALGLHHLLATRAVEAGMRVLLFGGGAGYTCTAAVVEILDIPEWS
jgi:3-oxoacyl-[acyl-carrier-protein] synthase III